MSRSGNLRGAPLFLRPSVVRGLVEGVDAICKGLVQVPIAPIKLVDRPRASEDPRLAKANDDGPWLTKPKAKRRRSASEVAQQVERLLGEPGSAPQPALAGIEDWPDAPLPDHADPNQADPDLDRPEPAELNLDVASFGRSPVKESGLDGMAEKESASQTQLVAAQSTHGCGEKRSPTPLSLPAAKPERMPPPIKRQRGPATVDEAALPEPVRSPGEQIRKIADRLAAERKVGRRIDWKKVAEVHRAKAAPSPKKNHRPLTPAPSREECPRCGIPGWKGCDHFLPCEDVPIDGTALSHANTGPRV